MAIELWSAAGQRLAQAGSGGAVAWTGSEIAIRNAGSSGVLLVSITHAGAVTQRIERLTKLEVAALRGPRPLVSTLRGTSGIDRPPPVPPLTSTWGARSFVVRAKRNGKNRVERALTLMPEPSSTPR